MDCEMEVDTSCIDAVVGNDEPIEGSSLSSFLAFPPLPEYPPSHWKYEMRREMQEICPDVYFGSYASATRKKLEELKDNGFTHIVCVRHVLERRVIKPNFPDYFVYKVVEMNENSIQSIIPQCISVCEFISQVLDDGGKVLIHGNGGAGSSAILIIAFVMFRYGVSPAVAHNYVQQRRFCIRPTDNYLEQLKEFEPIFRAKQLGKIWQNSWNNNNSSSSAPGLKRSIDQVLEGESTVMKRSLEDGSEFGIDDEGDGDHLA